MSNPLILEEQWRRGRRTGEISGSAPSQSLLSVAVVVHHSALEPLRVTLSSLAGAVAALSLAYPGQQFDLVLLDNSCDVRYTASVKKLLDSLSLPHNLRLNYQQTAHNGGFGHGHNRALEQVDSRYHLILNPDVELAEDALLNAVRRLENSADIALLSPFVRDKHGQQIFLCKAHPSISVLLLRAFAPSFIRRWFAESIAAYELQAVCSEDQEVDVALASGCFMFLRTETMRDLGGFDERFFLYFEDFDLSKRLSQQGRVVFCPSIEIVHYGGHAARKGLRHIMLFLRSGCRFFNKYGWRWF